ncbi:helix-turn-helix transcriptional regulator [Paenibacillus dokdonensis]|uniref:Helix-turn-helix transcriptional regulator n=1 Tax=Paenibacillus dokdonensis TaxID=2567944 RepID=A0ABU6GSD9_9BACL|nr:helix-turn-helix transcriptional regulator [Paenibacillus dokdonensis]MEC0242022.1 helix-turn-helix transcriptional regulator [Paenibacillus dokdonensis]
MFQMTLRAARVNRGFNLKEVASIVGKCPETIGKYENDSTEIPRGLFLDLVKLYGVPEEMIFCGKESVFTGFHRRSRKKQKAS